ncbi:MAG: hypothetical protein J6V09_06680 [Clostridia bacterium]|nr:hypothetical protein [Clostridia bacterium]
MKTTKKLLAFLLVLVMAVSAMASCTPKPSGEVTIVIAGEDVVKYVVDTEKIENCENPVDVLEYLKVNEGLNYSMDGTMISTIGELANDFSASKYICIYTSVVSDFDVSEWASTVEYDGKTLTSSRFGLDEMTITNGAIIYFTVISYA